MSRLGASPPPYCVCGHPFHVGPCDDFDDLHDKTCGELGCIDCTHPCHCPNGELDEDR